MKDATGYGWEGKVSLDLTHPVLDRMALENETGVAEE